MREQDSNLLHSHLPSLPSMPRACLKRHSTIGLNSSRKEKNHCSWSTVNDLILHIEDMSANKGLVCLQDYEQYAHQNLDKNALDYYRSGAGDEYSLELNRTSFKSYRIRPCCLVDVSSVDVSTQVLGTCVSLPVGISPTAMQRMAHPDGECATARVSDKYPTTATSKVMCNKDWGVFAAAGDAGTVFILSTLSTSSVEEVSAAAPHTTKWFQLYIYKDRELTEKLVKRVEDAGYQALVLTVDAPVFGIRRSDVRNKFKLPPHLTLANFKGLHATDVTESKGGSGINEYVLSLFDPALSWEDINWLKSITKLPIILKGILTAQDAVRGVDAGAAAILVSNHGARQIDSTPASIEVLPEVVKAVGGRVEVYLDGGVRQGTDIFKALALGAKMVFVGRPALWGLTHSGQQGVKNILDILKWELETTFSLTGCNSVQNIRPCMVVHKSFYHKL
ncbi:hypothetical protein PR048_027224 [Dryococelus australis]|uniref:FMN hydroxy acid dehydrogenase domain-containing protein n=1 Tax=Dryococelus australis TaxID=614101 RepID=A0ABQ9GEV2_9NEOP|nr:hypothetical protein PR048_027224 [Dryococelus australis]